MTVLVARPVLADRLFPRSIAVDAGLVLSGAALTALLAQLEVPLWPVPITGQTLAVLLVGAALGPWRAGASMVLYAVAGVAGLPVFTDHAAGFGVIAGPTGGYIAGFLPAAVLTGWLATRRADRRLLHGLLAFIAGSGVVFAIGLPWLKADLGLSWPQTLASGLYPFVIGGLIKAAIAAGVLRGAWALVDRADTRR